MQQHSGCRSSSMRPRASGTSAAPDQRFVCGIFDTGWRIPQAAGGTGERVPCLSSDNRARALSHISQGQRSSTLDLVALHPWYRACNHARTHRWISPPIRRGETMEGLFSLLLFAALFYFMMRFGCGAHMVHGHGGHGGQREHTGHQEGPRAIDPVCGAVNRSKFLVFSGPHARLPRTMCGNSSHETHETKKG